MTTTALFHAVSSQLHHGEAPVGFCIVFAGLTWGTLAGGLLAGEPILQFLAAGAGVLLGTLLFVSRELMLARAAIAQS